MVTKHTIIRFCTFETKVQIDEVVISTS